METLEDAQDEIRQLKVRLEVQQMRVENAHKDRDEAFRLVDQMREHVEDAQHLIERWQEAFEMVQDADGTWQFDPTITGMMARHDETREKYIELLARWNKLVPRYNAKIAPQPIGRPMKASTAQVEDVKRRHKAGESLRKIATATGLSFRTVRTIVGKADGTDRTSRRHEKLRRLEFDRLRAAEYRRRKKMRDALPKQIGELQERGAALVKAAKGLGQD